uniref:p67 n=1 Tax=Saccharolobus solfataricus TaxID=2287 RepID=Q6PN94_SACSO|nr:p67 [Saccharolobus solfataricus]
MVCANSCSGYFNLCIDHTNSCIEGPGLSLRPPPPFSNFFCSFAILSAHSNSLSLTLSNSSFAFCFYS